MKRIINIAATMLMIGGLALLAFAGISYFHRPGGTAAPSWNKTEQARGREIAAHLAAGKGTPTQKVQIPSRLKHARAALAGSEPGIRLVIPRIDLDAPIVDTPPVNGVWQVADWAVGHLSTTPNPGAPGNMALSAHDDIKGEVFKRLGELRPGDSIEIFTPHMRYTYVVVNEQTVDPSDVGVLNPTKAATVTLISCTPYWVDTERLVIQGMLKSRTTA